MQERKAASFGGGLALLLWVVAWVVSVYYIVQGGKLGQVQPQPVAEIGRDVVIAVVAFIAGCVLLKGVIVVQPNDARARSALANNADGSPGRRARFTTGMLTPETSSHTRMTSRTLQPRPRPRLQLPPPCSG